MQAKAHTSPGNNPSPAHLELQCPSEPCCCWNRVMSTAPSSDGTTTRTFLLASDVMSTAPDTASNGAGMRSRRFSKWTNMTGTETAFQRNASANASDCAGCILPWAGAHSIRQINDRPGMERCTLQPPPMSSQPSSGSGWAVSQLYLLRRRTRRRRRHPMPSCPAARAV